MQRRGGSREGEKEVEEGGEASTAEVVFGGVGREERGGGGERGREVLEGDDAHEGREGKGEEEGKGDGEGGEARGGVAGFGWRGHDDGREEEKGARRRSCLFEGRGWEDER